MVDTEQSDHVFDIGNYSFIMDLSDSQTSIFINAVISVFGFFLTLNVLPKFKDMFIKANLYGIDQSKPHSRKIPEAQGVICGAIFLIMMFIFIPVPFYKHLSQSNGEIFPHNEYVEFIAALLSICCMIFLGFADDVLDLKWRHKLLLPTMSSLPLLMVYFLNFGGTVIIVPTPLRVFFGYDLNIGIFYYVYMGMLAVFCTNAINILAGVNGLEAGQALVIAVSVLIFNVIELSGDFYKAHTFSLYFIMPYIAVCLALLYYNWYPSSLFIGDTFCYFSGMTFAVVAILGHFSKTMLLFFIPQIVNFLYSVPQLFHFVPCPRHRLPKYDKTTDKVGMSCTTVKEENISFIMKIIFKILHFTGFLHLKYNAGEDGKSIEFNNMTIINLVVKFCGPLNEGTLVNILLCIQVLCSILAFIIRYPLAEAFYKT